VYSDHVKMTMVPHDFTERYASYEYSLVIYFLPITVAERSKSWIVFARSKAGIVDSSPTRGMDVCVRLFCVCVALYVVRGLATGWSPFQGVLPSVYRIKKLKKRGQGPTKGIIIIIIIYVLMRIYELSVCSCFFTMYSQLFYNPWLMSELLC
jgi:hypothetical protein